MVRIGILGIGGVGGYFGGLLADKYHQSGEVQVVFIAKTATEKVIKEKGLMLITPQAEKTIFPYEVVSDTSVIKPLDVLIVTVKSYDLEESLIPLKPCITNDTIILPLLNGVDIKERIEAVYPNSRVINGTCYIIAKVIEPGVVTEAGQVHKMYFGSDRVDKKTLVRLYNTLQAAGIESYLSDNIERDVWEKYFMTAAMANFTSYFDSYMNAILKESGNKDLILQLLNELKAVADKKKVLLPDGIIELTMKKVESLPPDATSSMHRDYMKGGKTEYKSLTGYIAKLGDKLNIETPVFDMILAEFEKREATNSDAA